MADWGSAVVDRLTGDPDLDGQLAGRWDWGVSQPDTPYPRGVLTTVSDPRPDHFEGPDFRQTRLQLDVYSIVSADEARRLAERAIAVLQPEREDMPGVRFDRAGVDGPADSGEQRDTLYVHRSRVDFLLWHAET